MPIFKDLKHAQDTHRNYLTDTDAEGKYNRKHLERGFSRVEWLLKAVPEESFVLEIGCNSGGLLNMLQREKQCYVKGIDISAPLVQRALKKGINAVIGEAENLPFQDESFEVVIMTEIMEHLYDPKLALKEASRVLKKGGYFIGSVPHPDSHNSKKATLEEHHWHCHIFDNGSLEELFRDYFEKIQFDVTSWINDSDKKPQWIMWRCQK